MLKKIDFALYGFGMRPGGVELVKHRPEWRRCFAEVKSRLEKIFAGEPLKFHHVGSTAIPEIMAKPMLDVMGVVSGGAKPDMYRERLEQEGLAWMGEYGVAGRRYCVLYSGDGAVEYLHLHLYEAGHPEVENQLLFRDYLLAFPQAARDYERLKADLLNRYSERRPQYTEAKSDFVKEIHQKARNWRKAG